LRRGISSTAIPLDIKSIQGDPKEDWAIIRGSLPNNAEVPILPLSGYAEPAVGGSAFIVQHPGGERKRIAYVRNQITDTNNEVVHYLSDTQAGSSGSPYSMKKVC